MSSTLLLQGAAVCSAVTLATVVVLVARVIANAPAAPILSGVDMPWPIRLMYWPAAAIEPLVEPAVTASRSDRLARTLEALGFAFLTPARWESIRILHGVMLAAVVLIASAGRWPWMAAAAGAGGYLLGAAWISRLRRAQQDAIARELPAYLDLMTVCVEAGATLVSGLRMIIAQAPASPLREYFDRVLREIRSGRARAQAFSHVADLYDMEALSTLASALAHAEASGMSLGQVLRAQAEQRTAERFARAEKLAMQAPVKMLGPLIFCIFPCTFIVIGVPIVVRLREAFAT